MNWDDEPVLLGNPLLRGPWRLALLTSSYPDTYSPLCWVSLRALIAAFGFRPEVFHAASLAVHASAAAAVYLVARSLFEAARPDCAEPDRRRAALLAAALFAWHPLQAEMVAGAAYLTDLPACALALFSIAAYLRWARRGGRGWLRLCWALALAAGLWRWQAAALPVIVLVLDAYPLRRKAWAEKLPLLAVSAAVVAAHAWAKSRGQGYGEVGARPGAACLGLLHLALSWLAPGTRLPVYYYHDGPSPLALSPAQAAAAFSALTGLLLALRRRAAGAAAAWVCFAAAASAPLLFTGAQPTYGHDRYFYLAGAGFPIAAAGLWLGARRRAPLPASAAAALLLALTAAAGLRALGPWRSSEELWRAAYAAEPSTPKFSFKLGQTLLRQGRAYEALAYFRLQAQADGGSADARANIALAERLAASRRTAK